MRESSYGIYIYRYLLKYDATSDVPTLNLSITVSQPTTSFSGCWIVLRTRSEQGREVMIMYYSTHHSRSMACRNRLYEPKCSCFLFRVHSDMHVIHFFFQRRNVVVVASSFGVASVHPSILHCRYSWETSCVPCK